MEERFFLLNIKHNHPWEPDKSPAEYWLGSRSAAPIFYGDSTVESIRAAPASTRYRGDQSILFVNILDTAAREGFKPTFITIDSGKIWIYSPVRGPFEDPLIKSPGGQVNDLPKFFEVKIIKVVNVTDAPLVLSSMRANRWLSSGTFTPLADIRYQGNIEAARTVASLTGRPISRLDCLSSVELETLIAKLFEEQGFFVPAYRGGFVDGFDLVVEPPASPVPVPFDIAEDGMPLAIQVKLRVTDEGSVAKWLKKGKNRYLITAQNELTKKLQLTTGQVFTRSWLAEALAISPLTRKWLERSTYWIRQPTD